MKIIYSKNELINFVKLQKNLGFVPTMGAIHKGHISLVKESIIQSNKTIVSIFVNKPQFNKKNDFLKYPRNLKKDIAILRKLKVNYLYLPTSNQIYHDGPNHNLKINSFSKKLCGKNRPGHFKAVIDVIDRFIKIIKPNKIFLGEKDMQQLKLIENFVKKNYLNIKVIGCKTIREKNGIALSSRNFFLSLNEKKTASKIYLYLRKNKKFLIKKKISLENFKKNISKFKPTKIDYLELIDINKIIKPYKNKKKLKIFVAYYLRSTRLIDNI